MTKLKNFLRCYAMGMGIKSIANTFQISRNTVRKYVRRYQESGLSLEQLQSMSEDKLQDMFLDNRNRCRQPSSRMEELEALVPDYVKRLSQKGVTVKSLHEEYLSERPSGYRYSNFKRAIRRYKYQLKAEGHVEHLAGDQKYIDYAGDKLEIVDAETGEVQGVEDYVAKYTNPNKEVDYFDGLSFDKTLTGKEGQQAHDFLYWEFEETNQVAVRMGDWKMVSKAGKPHLYDLSKDVHEDHDIAEQHPDIVKKLVEIAHSQHTESPYFKVTMPEL